MNTQQSWTASLALMITAALLAGCTGDSPDDEPTAAAPTEAPPPLPQPSRSERPSEEPSLSTRDEAARKAKAVYLEWVSFQNATLQDPPVVAGGEAGDAVLDQFLDQASELAIEEAQASLVTAVLQYNEEGWRQSGSFEVTSLATRNVSLSPGAGRPFVELIMCFEPDDLGVVTKDGTPAPEFIDVPFDEPFGGTARVEYLDEQGVVGWYVTSIQDDFDAEC